MTNLNKELEPTHCCCYNLVFFCWLSVIVDHLLSLYRLEGAACFSSNQGLLGPTPPPEWDETSSKTS